MSPPKGRETPDDLDTWVYRGEAWNGTTCFYHCANTYLMLHDMRLILAMVFVKSTLGKLAILKRLLSALRTSQVSNKCLYTDKGFCCIAVLYYLSLAYPGHYCNAYSRETSRQSSAVSRAEDLSDNSTLQNVGNGSLTVRVAVVRTFQRRRSGRRQLC
jgi:hypothetical protein